MRNLRQLFYTVIFLILFSALSFGQAENDIDDVDNYVTIGTQVWMVDNLKTTKFRNGDIIPNVTDKTAWKELKTGAWCYYDNNPANGAIYGKLYNWYAVNDPRGLAPKGWHIATDAEWTTLINYLGGESVAGGKLKEIGLAHWASTNTGATNETGFSAVPGGCRDYHGTFYDIGGYGYWWSSTEYGTHNAWYWSMHYTESTLETDMNRSDPFFKSYFFII